VYENVESLYGSLTQVLQYEDALGALGDLHLRLSFLTTPRPNSASRVHHISLSSFASDSSGNTTLLTVIFAYLTYSVGVLVPTTLPAGTSKDEPSVLEALATVTAFTLAEPTILEWIPQFSGLPAKQLDPLFTRTYSTIVKLYSLAEWNPRGTFLLQIYASVCLAHASSGTVEQDTVWDQMLKFAGASVKSQTVAEDEAIQVILSASAFSYISTRIEKGQPGIFRYLVKGLLGFANSGCHWQKRLVFHVAQGRCSRYSITGRRYLPRVTALVQRNSIVHSSNLHSSPSDLVTASTGNIKEFEDGCTLKKDWAALEAP